MPFGSGYAGSGSDPAMQLSVEGPGPIDCHLYQQPGRLILHLVNLTGAGAARLLVAAGVLG